MNKINILSLRVKMKKSVKGTKKLLAAFKNVLAIQCQETGYDFFNKL